jgi:competence protein ComEC
MTAHILNPVSGLGNPETNDASVVVLLDHGQNHFLFTGDIDGTIEATVVARGTPVTADVLKVAHHGSKYSSSAVFLSAVNPNEAVISVGNNSYGHPAAETIARLLAAGARVWRTDINGTIVITSDGVTYTVEPSTVYIYLPLVIKSTPPPMPTPTDTPSPTPTDTPTPTGTAIPPTSTSTSTSTPTSTPTQGVVTTGNVVITYIYYNGAGSLEPDEYVEIRNDDSRSIQLYNWTLRDIANHIYTFPSYIMIPGQVCRVYTNEYHPEWCGFDYGHGSAIWNNTGDCAYLRDATSTLIDDYCY